MKIVNPEQKSRFVTKIWHNVGTKFDSPATLKERLFETFQDKLPPISSLEIGYFERRGSAKRWIEDQDDLDAMYRSFVAGDEITLWVHGHQKDHVEKAGKKRKREVHDEPSSKRADRDRQIELVFQQLQELHNEQYSGPQLRLWARMKVNGQHDSMESPPNIPLFTPSKVSKGNSLNEALTSAATAVVSMLKGTSEPSRQGGPKSEAMSHGKRAHVSGTYLDHLDKLKKLLESGVLSQQEFEEQKRFILNNICSLNT